MITIFHGDNYVQSRQALNQSFTQTPERFAAADLTEETLTQALESNPMFQIPKIFVIENLLSLPRSQTKENLIKIVLNNPASEIILWEKKALSLTVKKQFVKAVIKEFKLPASLFNFLDNLTLANFHQALVNNPAELIFYLLHRRVSQLIQAVDDPGSLKGAPWQIGKLKNQAKKYSLDRLLNFHRQLLTLDEQAKTSQSILSLAGCLDLLLLEL
jgi:DNA polymerase III delta subunit